MYLVQSLVIVVAFPAHKCCTVEKQITNGQLDVKEVIWSLNSDPVSLSQS